MSPRHPASQPMGHTPVTISHDGRVPQWPHAYEQFGPQVSVGHPTIIYKLFT